ncbi:MAG TPA: hypothetical protein VG711_08140 [Phycisphaerales bacterium]|nr:hypothetical protein [Phycisphaerales bacterium]
MAIAHICQGCGRDLARRRAQIEPHYHLPIVRCGECDFVNVRRPHPLPVGWKRLKQVDFALTVLVLQLIAGLLMLMLWWLLIPMMTTSTIVGLRRHETVTDLSVLVVFAGFAVLVTCVWLRVAFARFHYIAVLGWWSLVAFAGMIMATGVFFWITRIEEGRLALEIGRGPTIMGSDAISIAAVGVGACGAASSLAFFAVSPIGYVLGNVVLAVLNAFRRHLRHRHRKSIRMLRAG